MRVLLLQFRPDPVVSDHEYHLVLKGSGLQEGELVVANALVSSLGDEVLEGIDAVIIGGSGDYLLSRGDIPEVVERVARLIQVIRERRIPLLGICFGAQLMTQALGGKVELDVERAELGTFDIETLPAAARCPLFGEASPRFAAQLGHKDHLTVLPEGAVHLAASERSRHQAYTFVGEPLYALTFHPELDEEAVLYRVDYYATEYLTPRETLVQMRERVRPSPEASSFLSRFIERIVREGVCYP